MKVIGIDYGTKRVGVAISDEMQSMAFPREVLENNARLIPALNALIQKEGVGEVVVGNSLNYAQGNNPLMDDIIRFKHSLMEEAGVEVHLESEILTSQQAMREQGDTAMLDASAASLILGSFLQRRHGFEL